MDMEKNELYYKRWLQWFIGFSDAEGNFQLHAKKRVLKSGEISKYNVGYSFTIALYSRDSELINDIKKT
jgi:hypothetical protein